MFAVDAIQPFRTPTSVLLLIGLAYMYNILYKIKHSKCFKMCYC